MCQINVHLVSFKLVLSNYYEKFQTLKIVRDKAKQKAV